MHKISYTSFIFHLILGLILLGFTILGGYSIVHNDNLGILNILIIIALIFWTRVCIKQATKELLHNRYLKEKNKLLSKYLKPNGFDEFMTRIKTTEIELLAIVNNPNRTDEEFKTVEKKIYLIKEEAEKRQQEREKFYEELKILDNKILKSL